MELPFTREAFLAVFSGYNEATWPASLCLAGLATLAVVSLARKWRNGDRFVSGVLALLWAWSGIVYHLLYFSRVNPTAIGFGAFFLIQSIALFWSGVWRHEIVFDVRVWNARVIAGALIVTYSLVIYPWIGVRLGHRWPHSPTFGAPCPMVLFTLGILVWASPGLPKSLLLAPLGWAWIGTNAALKFGIYQDWALPVVGTIVGSRVLLCRRDQAAIQRG